MPALSFASFDSTLFRVQLSLAEIRATLGVNTTALLERSDDQVRWTTVRGGGAVNLNALSLPADDFEYSPDALNYYRATAATPAVPGPGTPYLIGTPAATTGTLTVVLPVTHAVAAGDRIIVAAGSSADAATGVTDSQGNSYTLATSNATTPRTYFFSASAAAPLGLTDAITVTFGTTGATHNVIAAGCSGIFTAAAQDRAVNTSGTSTSPSLASGTLTQAAELAVAVLTSSNAGGAPSWGGGFTSLGTAHTGSAQYTSAAYKVTASTGTVTASATITSTTWTMAVVTFKAVTAGAVYTDSITPALNGTVVLKSLRYPFLNLAVFPSDASDVTRRSLGATFDVMGRSAAVAVTQTRASAQFDLTLATQTAGDRDDLRALVATGDVLLLQNPPGSGCQVDSGYFAVGDVTETRNGVAWDRRWFTLPLTGVAAPGSDVVAVNVTWQSVVNGYSSWSDLVLGQATWNDVLSLVGAPGDVITG